VRAVLDPNILAREFELVVSEALLGELERALAYPKLRTRIAASEAAEFVALLGHGAIRASDPPVAARRSTDDGDDYLPALAESERALVVSGDQHLLALAGELPIQTARVFLDVLGQS
jgi:predicted nucleic acid-binding protein